MGATSKASWMVAASIGVVEALKDQVIFRWNYPLRVFPIDRATHREASAKNLLDGPIEVFGHGSRARNLGGLNDVVKGDIPIVLDILCLLPVMLPLLQCLDDQSRRRWHHRHLRGPIFGANELAVPTSPPMT
nr:hypothetical protein CFP56_65709 [Quercus suber]